MKLLLNSFFFCFVLFCFPVYGEKFHNKYTVKVSGIKIGELIWGVTINDTNYINEINLKSEGLLSALYRFEGRYYSKGIVERNDLKPNKYIHFWKTNKTIKNMELLFKDYKLASLTQKPFEKENLRINIFNINNYKDPLTSFLQIILGKKNSLVIDGRRIYTMQAAVNNQNNLIVVEILNYSNLWADHKRTKFEKLTFKKKEGEIFPSKINIYFDGRIFKLEKN